MAPRVAARPAPLPRATDALGNAAGAPASDYAVRFDGVDDAISLPNAIGQTFTIAFWYKAGASSQANPFTIDGGANGAPLRIYNNTPLIEFRSGGTQLTAPRSLSDGQWHFIVATRNTSGRVALYVDGNVTPIASLNSPAVYQVRRPAAISPSPDVPTLLPLLPAQLPGSVTLNLPPYLRSRRVTDPTRAQIVKYSIPRRTIL